MALVRALSPLPCSGTRAAGEIWQGLSLSQWQLDSKGTPFARGALNLDLSAMCVDDAARNRQAQAAPAVITVACVIRAVKALEDVGQIGRRDAYAGVAYSEPGLSSCGRQRERDQPFKWRIFERVVNQGAHRLLEGIFVAVDPRRYNVL